MPIRSPDQGRLQIGTRSVLVTEITPTSKTPGHKGRRRECTSAREIKAVGLKEFREIDKGEQNRWEDTKLNIRRLQTGI